MVIRTLIGVQESYKRSQELINEESTWLQQIASLLEMSKDLKLSRFNQVIFSMTDALKCLAGEANLDKMFSGGPANCRAVRQISIAPEKGSWTKPRM